MQTLKVIFFGLVAYALFYLLVSEIIHYGDMREALGRRLGADEQSEICRANHQGLLWNQISDKDKYEMKWTARRK